MTIGKPSGLPTRRVWVTPQSRADGRPPAGESRGLILDATAGLLADHRVEELSLRSVCMAAGVSQGAMHAAFGDLEALLLAVFDAVAAKVGAGMAAAQRAEPVWADGVRAAVYELVTFSDEQPGLARFVVVDSLTYSAALSARRAEALARLGAALDAGSPPPRESVPASFGGESVVSAAAAVLHGLLLTDGAPSREELSRFLTGLLVLPYLGVAGTREELERAEPPADVAHGLRTGRMSSG